MDQHRAHGPARLSAADFAERRFAGEFRTYQRQALDAFDADRADGPARSYLVLPPGAGKTVIGLEAARRIGHRTLVLVPNTAVLGQWARTWDEAFAGESTAGTDRSLDSPLTVLTYQSIAVVDDAGSALERRSAVRGADRDALLAMLHDNGRAVIERAAALGPWTLVLDECHHLLALWGALVRLLVDELGPATSVIGLTATPPALLTGWQRELRDDLFGPRDFEVPTPALVKSGDLAPYQELVYLTAPTPAEDTWLAAQGARFADLQVELADERSATIPLFGWLRRRLVERSTAEGAPLSWSAFEAAAPDLARSGLRFAVAGFVPVPDDARVREQHRLAPTAQDWVTVLADYVTGHLQASSDPRDVGARTAIGAALPALGYRLTKRGILAATSPVDRVCGLSEAKIAGAVQVLAAEDEALGDELRALVLCDFEQEAGRLPASLRDAPLTTESGSARLAFETLAAADVGGPGGLRPLLVTGATFAAPAALADAVIAFAAEAGVTLVASPYPGPAGLRRLEGPGRSARHWVETATRFFAAGHARVLIGTRALLGEGWDCAAVNVSVDLTTAATPTAVVQMRGRSLRLDPTRPGKVADNWTICCVAPDRLRGDADYQRLVRKHAAYFAPAGDGTIESGISHCDPALSPFGAPLAATAAQVTAAALERVGGRAAARTRWAIGGPFAGIATPTLRVRAGRDLGTAGRAAPGLPLRPPVPGERWRASWGGIAGAGLTAGAGVGAGIGGGAAAGAIAAGAVVVAGGAAVLGIGLSRGAPAPAAVDTLAAAIADALLATGATSRGGDAVRIATTVDGWLRCELAGVTTEESERFVAALDELLAPLAEPRWMIGRRVIPTPATRGGRIALAARSALGLAVAGGVTWQAVPRVLASSQARRAAFAAAWDTHVGPPRLLDAASPDGRAVLDLFRGEDPFSIVTQLRTTWH